MELLDREADWLRSEFIVEVGTPAGLATSLFTTSAICQKVPAVRAMGKSKNVDRKFI